MNLKQTVKKYVGGLIMQVVQDITSCWLVNKYACQQALYLRRLYLLQQHHCENLIYSITLEVYVKT
jgi:hypothetical protein